MARHSRFEKRRRLSLNGRAVAIAGACVVVVGIAVPVFLSGDDPSADFGPGEEPVAAPVLAPIITYDEERAVHVTDMMVDAAEPPAPPPPRITASADGDLEVALELRWPEFEEGERILAKARFVNHSLKTLYLPASGEPNPGFAIVVEDADGNEVRRIAETGRAGQLARRLVKLPSAEDVVIRFAIVAETDAPLAPGTYTACAEFQADTRLARLGLPVWTAPKGPVRSLPVRFVVKPRTN